MPSPIASNDRPSAADDRKRLDAFVRPPRPATSNAAARSSPGLLERFGPNVLDHPCRRCDAADRRHSKQPTPCMTASRCGNMSPVHRLAVVLAAAGLASVPIAAADDTGQQQIPGLRRCGVVTLNARSWDLRRRASAARQRSGWLARTSPASRARWVGLRRERGSLLARRHA